MAPDHRHHGRMTPLTPRPTMDDVARIAGVSKKTISRFINNSPDVSAAMRARVEAAIAQLGFVPNAQARALALRRSFLVALVHDGSDRGVREAVETGMLRAMEGSELALVLLPLRRGGTAELRAFLDRHAPAGVVLLPPLSERGDLAAVCDAAGTRCIRLGHDGGDSAADGTARTAMADLVRWLLDNGHRRIGLIGGPEDSRAARQRELGYQDALASRGLNRGPWLVASGDNSFTSGMEAACLLLELSPRPTAIVACNDEMAAGALAAAAGMGIAVPGALSVAGFDDTPLATMTVPPLASVHVPWDRLGHDAVMRLAGAASAPSPETVAQARPVLRASVAPIGEAARADLAAQAAIPR
ncbi:LacI family DNA-binding transcriptional regulator [Novosphingobium sp. BL-8A]|uniref:LacI family DNA-binding transcriptional regulator n=1 Tax=Novosphingobium sp. BL-8A TaxID=3127639 RepID=UPI0037571845